MKINQSFDLLFTFVGLLLIFIAIVFLRWCDNWYRHPT